jgi:hypothetical protein
MCATWPICALSPSVFLPQLLFRAFAAGCSTECRSTRQCHTSPQSVRRVRHWVSTAEVLGNCLNNPLVSQGRKRSNKPICVRRLSKFARLLLNGVVMASEHSFNVTMRNIGLWVLLEGVSDENHLTSEVGRINEIGMGQNSQQHATLGIRKGLNKFLVDSLGKD